MLTQDEMDQITQGQQYECPVCSEPVNICGHGVVTMLKMERARAEAAEGREARLRDALIRSRAWLVGAWETFGAATDCRETPVCSDRDPTQPLDEGCDAYCERAHDMRRGIVEIDAALDGTPEGESAPACTEDRHIVLPSGEACVCGENRSELLL